MSTDVLSRRPSSPRNQRLWVRVPKGHTTLWCAKSACDAAGVGRAGPARCSPTLPDEPAPSPQAEARAPLTIEVIEAPLVVPGVEGTGRTWRTTRSHGAGSYGCGSHIGPLDGRLDKENEDFAFAVQVEVRGETWLLVGVADGVGGSTWGERAAQHAAAAFIEATYAALASDGSGEALLRDPVARSLRFVRPLSDRVRARLEADRAALTQSRMTHASWDPALYRARFFEGDKAAERRATWLQSTLLACALGPRGGFALLLGDGFARVDRVFPDARGVQRREVDLAQPDGAGPALRVSPTLTDGDIEAAFRSIAPSGARAIGVMLATDGVAMTRDHGLGTLDVHSHADCDAYLSRLVGRPSDDVNHDNLSIAFARREFAA
jgi:hypothetical protein